MLVALAMLHATGTARADKAECLAAYEDGQVRSRSGELLAARDALRVCASAPCPEGLAPECTQWLADVERRLPSIVVAVRTADGRDAHPTRVLVDGRPASTEGREIAVDPGPHVVRVEGGFTATEARILAVENEKGRIVRVTVAAPALPPRAAALPASPPPSPPPPSEQRDHSIPMVTWGAGGVAVAGLTSFAVFGLLGNDAWNDLDACSPRCTDDETRKARTLYTVGDVSLGVGVVAVGVAVVTYLLWDRAPARHGR